jgi:parallel beta-helix repeat protein
MRDYMSFEGKSKTRSLILVLALTLMIASGILTFGASNVQAAVQATYYVSPSGNDSNPGTLSQPFKTITKARNVVRTINNSMTGDIIVNLRAGDYFIDSTVVFNESDSGTNGHHVIYKTYASDALGSARIIGGQKLTGWTLDSANTKAPGKVYKTNVGTSWDFDTLFENGERANMSRFPNTGYSKITKSDSTQPKKAFFYSAAIPSIADISNLQVYVWPGAHNWANEILPITAINYSTKKITLSQNQRYPYLDNLSKNSRFFVQGAYELLDYQGEFYLDKAAGYLYYYPLDPTVTISTINNLEIIAPKVDKVLLLNGSTNTNLVKNIDFEGLTVMVSNSTYLDMNQSNTGNIIMINAENITIKNSRIVNAAANGIAMPPMDFQATPARSRVQNNLIYGNFIQAVGDNGVVITGVGNTKVYMHTNNTISNNKISDIAKNNANGAGVRLSNAGDSEISYNDISNAKHYGIEIKGSKWTAMPAVIEGITVTPTNKYDFNPGRNNVIKFNDVYNVNLDTQDTGIFKSGGVYMMTIDNNIFHNSGNFSLQKGLYLDDISDYNTVTNNIVYGLKGSTKIVYNIKGTGNLVQNNIADATGGAKGMQFNIIDAQPTKNNTLLNNIIYNARVFYTLERYRSDYVQASDYNVFYSSSGAKTFSGIPGNDTYTNWRTLQGNKFDQHSTTANPLFVNAAAHNYTLKTTPTMSPALARGFVQIDTSTVGLKPDYPYSDTLTAMTVETNVVEPDPEPSFFEGFEDGFAAWTPNYGTPTASTAQAYTGTNSFLPNEDQDEIYHVMDDQTYGIVTVRFYDNTSSNNLKVRARLANSTTEENAMIGVATYLSTSKYAYLVDGTTFVASSVNRSTGWHEFKFDMSSGTDTKLYIDGTLIATTDIITAFDQIFIGDNSTTTQGNVYFDDVALYDNYEQYVE